MWGWVLEMASQLGAYKSYLTFFLASSGELGGHQSILCILPWSLTNRVVCHGIDNRKKLNCLKRITTITQELTI